MASPNPPLNVWTDPKSAFNIVRKALFETPPRTVHFSYEDGHGEITERHVEPYELFGERTDGCLLKAHDLAKGQTRQFKVLKMSAARLGEPFRPRWPVVSPV